VYTNRVHVRSLCKRHDARQDFLRIVDDGARLRAWHQRSVRTVRAIGECFTRRPQSRGSSSGNEFRLRKAEQYQRRIHRRNRPGDRVCDASIADRHIVESAVRLHVLEFGTRVYSDRCQRVHLANDEIGNLFCRQIKIAATEVFAIVETRVRPDSDAMFDSQ
jgi:hypothetical protein